MNLSTRYTGYQYCEKWPVNDREDLEGCTECLQAAGNNYLANCEFPDGCICAHALLHDRD